MDRGDAPVLEFSNDTRLAAKKGNTMTVAPSKKKGWEDTDDSKEEYNHEAMAHALWHDIDRMQGMA